MKLKLSVNQQDIEFGIQDDPTLCPIARGISRLFLGEDRLEVYVWDDYIEVKYPGAMYRAIVTADMLKFIRAFDKEEIVTPFEYELEFNEDEPIEDMEK